MTVAPEELLVSEAPPSAPAGYLTQMLHNRQLMIGAFIFAVIAIIAIIANLTMDPDARRTGAMLPRVAPSSEAILGSTTAGQNVAALMAEAIPNSMQVGLIAAALGTLIGAALGFASGYFGGWIDAVLRVLVDVFLSVPSLLFLVLIASLVRGIGVPAMAVIIGLFAWAWPARQIRAQVLSLKTRPFVDVARLSGMSAPEIIVRELVPQMLPWLGANFVNAFIAAVLAESGLSILGLGPQREMTLGMMIYWALSYGAILQNVWWWWVTPVVTLMVLFLALYLIHLGLDEVANPRVRAQV